MTETAAAGAEVICGHPCPWGGTSAARKHSNSDLGWMGHCNRKVAVDSDRCGQHKAARS